MPQAPQRGPRRRRTTKKRDRRPHSSARGYGYRWQKYARGYLERYPLCRPCERANRVTAAEAVDHIDPVSGPDDPKFWTPANHQPICWRCHSSKTATERHGKVWHNGGEKHNRKR